MSKFPLIIKPFGEQAVLIEWPEKVDEAILKDVLQFSEHLKKNCLDPKEWEQVPAYNSLALITREEALDFRRLNRELHTWYQQITISSIPQRYIWKLPVCYAPDFGIDLDELSATLGLSSSEIIKKHTAQRYTVYGIGFLPGFMYLGGVPEALETPRRKTPRLKVEKGAVGLAGEQTGIYPQESPGGWNIIGNCPIPIFDASKPNPCLVKVGDQVQFYSISIKEHELHKIEAEVGIFEIEKIKRND